MNLNIPNPLLVLPAIMLATSAAAQGEEGVFDSAEHSFRVEQVVTGLKNPWGLAVLPDGDMLVTERGGRLRRNHRPPMDPAEGRLRHSAALLRDRKKPG